ncbi:Uncharacterized HTH-type transcriptional regulator YcgK [Candidatus Hydrogenisulfobacillus filiaventi]|uniref:Uncharacterized HTH-type transcriptional regulator YcgK n=1 Tax=Candidatus Hydrogenisulfobacillus filiaventi TaxID=2707344 RepID=A0A6F8ZHV8_9FIRM|nr:LysR family transcriptional regulator [Bacillota bacterium]CAB1129303.1 Uncharacterized HTH-type transcriptional regulator YcgK [Candidatus Hydrogenisulfobacillus filiaventi]
MELRTLRYALEVARQASFTGAARALHIAQPSLSQQIARLEEELGMPLFYRRASGVEPTPDGRRFLEQAERIVRLEEDLVREMRERREGIGPELVVGAPAITGEHVLPPVLGRFQSLYPRTRVRLVEDSPHALEALTARGLTDLSILPLPVEDTRLAIRPLFTEPILLALPPQPAAWIPAGILPPAGSRVGLAAVAGAPFILLKPGYGFRQTVLELCAAAGFQPRVVYETSSIEMAQSLVAHGLGVTLVPAMVRRRGSGTRPHYRRLQELPTRTLALVWARDRYLSLAARAFLQLLPQAGATG